MVRTSDEQLLSAACSVFADRGFQQATMEAIAERAGTTKPTLYARMGDKDALYEAALAHAADALSAWVTTAYEAAASLPVEQKVRVYVMALFNFASAHPASFRLLFEAPMTGRGAGPRRGVVELITARVTEQVGGFLQSQGSGPGPGAELLASLLVTMVGRAAEWALERDEVEPLAAGEVACSFILAALRGMDAGKLAALNGI